MRKGKHRISGKRWLVALAAALVVYGMATATASAAVVKGKLYSWGYNGNGQLGLGHNITLRTPQPVPGMDSGVKAIAASYEHGLAARNGTLYAWGSNVSGQLGGVGASNTPRLVAGVDGGVTAVAVGTGYSLAIQSGKLYKWGSDGVTNSPIPSLVTLSASENDVTAIATGNGYYLAIQDRKLYAWGSNTSGQLGLGNYTSYDTPQLVLGMEGNVTAIAAFATASMAVMDGRAYVWGSMWGTGYRTPQEVAGLTNIVDVAIGYTNYVYSYYALDADGVLWAWGSNRWGQLGIESGFDTTTLFTTPQRVGEAEGLTFASISAGAGFVLAIGGKPVPEPVSLSLLMVGAAAVLSRRRRR